MRTVVMQESIPLGIEMSGEEAEALRALGRRLASDRAWWGDDDRADDAPRQVIRCVPAKGTTHIVRVYDAVGVVAVGDLQLIVQPKIPLDHLVYLLGKARRLPRTDQAPTKVPAGEGFHDLVARWFVDEAAAVIQSDLVRDYELVDDDTPAVRGRIDVLATTRHLVRGRLLARCRFDEFGVDTPLNRVIAAAAVARSDTFEHELRRRARRLRARLEGVGDLRAPDRGVRPDGRSRHYARALTLAGLVLDSCGFGLAKGARAEARTFLFRTPEFVEVAVRTVLAEHLAGRWSVRKHGIVLGGSRRRTLTPDLVFGETTAVADIKYSRTAGRLKREHLNQLATFAVGFDTDRAALITFDQGHGEHAFVGGLRLDVFNWDREADTPAAAAAALAAEVCRWLDGSARALPNG